MELCELFNLDELKNIFKHFTVTTNLGVALINERGEVVVECRKPDCLCVNVLANDKCGVSLAYGGRKSAQLGEPYIYACGCGLVMCSSPIMLDNNMIGSIVCGPSMLWEKDDFALSELTVNTADMGISSQDLVKCLNSSLQLDCVNINSAAQILFIMAGALCRGQSLSLKQQNEINRQQAEIGVLIANQKDAGLKRVDTEKELIVAMQLGDATKARAQLNKLLGEIFSTFSLDSMRVKLYELTAVLSRASVDAGAPLEILNPIIKRSVKLFGEDTDFEKLCFLTKEILDGFLDVLSKSRGKKQKGSHLQKAIVYINENYSDELSLELVSSKIFVSVFYLSHLFRDEMNTTFSDYVTKVRIDKAKEMLSHSDKSVSEVASCVGYNDSGYFSKAFKKETGLTPAQYKKI